MDNMQTLYDGYLWYSDKSKPDVLKGKPFSKDSLDKSDNPFVIEGQLWCKENGESISIKYVDGEYIIKSTFVPKEDLNKEKSDLFTKKRYIPHHISGVEKLVFLQYWRKETDEECNSFETLLPDNLVFIGFE